MDSTRFPAATRKLEEQTDPPVLILGRPLKIYDVDFPSADFAIEERLPLADRAVLELAQARGVVTAGAVRTFLGLGPELSPHFVMRLQKLGLLRESDLAPRPTFARPVEPAPVDHGPGLALTEAGAKALAAGARIVIHQRPLRLLMSDDPLVVLSVLPQPKHARIRNDPSLAPTDVPKPLQMLDALLRAAPNDRFEALGLVDTLNGLPGGTRIEGRLLGCSPGASYEVRPAPENQEAWLLIALHTAPPDLLTAKLYTALIRRDKAEPRTLAHIHPSALVPDGLPRLRDVDEILKGAGLRVVSPAAAPPFPLLADGATLLDLLGPGDQPAPVWRPLRFPGDAYLARVRLRGLPASIEAAHEALLTFLARRPDALRKSLERAISTTWTQLCSFWAWRGEIPLEMAMVRERLWARPALRGVLCASRLERDLVLPYQTEASHG